MSSRPYFFSTALFGHTSDVRCVTVTNDGSIVSGSRDLSARLWKRESKDTRNFYEALALTCHSNFVSSVCFLTPTARYPNGVIVTGSNDKKIRLFDPTITAPFHVLHEHSNTVCKLALGKAGLGWAFLSASWDMTARAWKEENSEWKSITLTGHSATVWSVCVLVSGLLVTASADKSLRVYSESGVFQLELKGHTDCVRDVVALGVQEVVSVANDATVRCWNVQNGACTHTFSTHQHYIYSVAVLDGIGWVTSSEDKTVKIWTPHGEVQSLTLPCASVWAVAVLPNSDIVTGSDDGIVRIFSTDPQRIANAQTLAAYDEEVAKSVSEVQSSGTQPVKLSELPEREALNTPGKTDGQSKVIRVGNKAIAFTWSAARCDWEEVGEVMGYGESERMFNGKEYDYVFSVDIEDGKPPLKLPYNKTEDPWEAANRFLEENFLPLSYLEQVANFIINCIGKAAVPAPTNTGFVDPFTGASRYVPSGNGLPASAPISHQVPVAPKGPQYYPQQSYLRFDQLNISVIKDKILQLSRDHDLGVTEEALTNLLAKCESPSVCTTEDITLLDRLISWDKSYVFPVLDALRLLIRQPTVADIVSHNLIEKLKPCHGVHPNNLLLFRIFSNMMSTPPGEAAIMKEVPNLFAIISAEPTPHSTSIQVGMATLFLNLTVLFRRHNVKEHLEDAFNVSLDILSKFNNDEAIFRALVALGTLLSQLEYSHRTGKLEPFKNLLQKLTANSAERVSKCAETILG